MYEAELFAIEQSINLMGAIQTPCTVNLCTDSQSCLSAITSENFPTQNIDRIRRKLIQLRNRRIDVQLWHVKAHTGLTWNEAVDLAAKNAARDGTLFVLPEISVKKMSRIIRSEIEITVDLEYMNDKFGTTVKLFTNGRLDPRTKLLQINTNSSKLYTGHLNSLSHLTRFRDYDNATCPCGLNTEQNVMHLLTNCRITQEDNNIYARQVGLRIQLIPENWEALTHSAAFHQYILYRAKSLIDKLKITNSKIVEERDISIKLRGIQLTGPSLLKRFAEYSAPLETPARKRSKQRQLKELIRNQETVNRKRRHNLNSITTWPLLKIRRPNEEPNELCNRHLAGMSNLRRRRNSPAGPLPSCQVS